MENAESTSSRLPKLSDCNYMDWAGIIYGFCAARGFGDALVRRTPLRMGRITFTAPEGVEAEEVMQARKAYDILMRSTDDKYLAIVRRKESPSEAWTALRNHFMAACEAQVTRYQKDICTAKIEHGRDPQEIFRKIRDAAQLLSLINRAVDETQVCYSMIDALNEDYGSVKQFLKAKGTAITPEEIEVKAQTRYVELQ
ncbi:unnamed protein product, partial [Discosporangium mesarthrocarpum]